MRILLALLLLTSPAFAADWPHWRGPSLKNIAPDSATPPPTAWDENTNIVWKAPIPGFGRSSPIIVGDRVMLTTADEAKQTQSVLCFNRATGERRWAKTVNQGHLQEKLHRNNSNATSTLICDGSTIYATFVNREKVQVTALSLEGVIQWQKDVGFYQPRMYQYGYGASPTIYKDSIIVTSEYAQGWIAAIDKRNGNQLCRIARPNHTSYY